MKALTELPKREMRRLSRSVPPPAPKVNGIAPKHPANIKTILVPVDFSPPSLKALNYAAELAYLFGAKIVLEHVVEPAPVVPSFAAYQATGFADAAVNAAREQLRQLAAKHTREPELIKKVNVRQGMPFLEITRAASAMKADLIVIATHGYTGVKHVLLGSTAERVVRYAACPVLVVPAHN